MHPKRRQRLTYLLVIMLGVSIAIGFVLYALRQNINVYYTPSQIIQGQAPKNHTFRLGGLVKQGSVMHAKTELEVAFIVTDLVHNINVSYNGILPDLFRDGQGVVVQGQLTAQNEFRASQVLAKHDEKYMPPIVKDALAQAKNSTV
ncbi:MAG: ccmE [Gammaproteobacteria bacterium]|jgi:cytochrome c-type biogenesis protein CcmE|nr:ccmE [Gammaproteobacteria bacterium]